GGSSSPQDDRAWDRAPYTRRCSCPGRAPRGSRSGRKGAARARPLPARPVTSPRSSQVILEREPDPADDDLVPVVQRGAARPLPVHPHAVPPGRVAHLVLPPVATNEQVMLRTAARNPQVAPIASANDNRAVGEREGPLLAAGLPIHV